MSLKWISHMNLLIEALQFVSTLKFPNCQPPFFAAISSSTPLRCAGKDSPAILWLPQIALSFWNLISFLWPTTLSPLKYLWSPLVHCNDLTKVDQSIALVSSEDYKETIPRVDKVYICMYAVAHFNQTQTTATFSGTSAPFYLLCWGKWEKQTNILNFDK